MKYVLVNDKKSSVYTLVSSPPVMSLGNVDYYRFIEEDCPNRSMITYMDNVKKF